MASATFRGVAAGEQLGNLEYLIDDSIILEYRRLVSEESSFVNLIADDCESMSVARFPGVRLSVVWRRFDCLRPPVAGRRIQAGGWLKEVGNADGKPWLRMSAFAVDDIGTEILRSEAAFVVGERDDNVLVKERGRVGKTSDLVESYDAVRVGDPIRLGTFVLPAGQLYGSYLNLRRKLTGQLERDAHNGTTQLLAGWLEGQIARIFGDDFRWGGRLALAYRGQIAPGDSVSAEGAVIERDEGLRGTSSIRISVTAMNQCNQPVVVGTASLKVPSPRLL